MCAHFLLKVATKDSFRYEKSQKIIISDAKILQARTKECGLFYHLQMFLHSFAKHFLGMSARKFFKKIKATQNLTFSNILKTQPE